MRCFFVSPEQVFEETLLLDREEGHHIRDVLRMRVGEALRVSDGSRYLYRAKILDYPQDQVLCAIEKQDPLPPDRGPRVTLLQSIPKGKRMDWLVQKVTEIGVHEIVPVTMQRSVRVLSPDPANPALQRWRRITKEAAKQSGRLGLPRICGPHALADAVRQLGDAPLRLYCDPSRQGRSLRRVRQSHPDPGEIAVVVGPEGGVSKADGTLLRDRGFLPVSLGQAVLRVETAGVVAIALIRYEWHDGGQTMIDEAVRS